MQPRVYPAVGIPAHVGQKAARANPHFQQTLRWSAARIVPFKVLGDDGYGQWSNLICAVDYLTGLVKDGNPNNDIWVANLDEWARTGKFERREISTGKQATFSGEIVGDTFFAETTLDALNGRIIAIDARMIAVHRSRL